MSDLGCRGLGFRVQGLGLRLEVILGGSYGGLRRNVETAIVFRVLGLGGLGF